MRKSEEDQCALIRVCGYVLLYCGEDGAVCEDCRGECEESGG